MVTSVEVQWVRTPHQDRSRRTLERLLDAAEGLLQERGFETVTVAEIAQAAGSSVGAFYARFRDKNGLLHHLHERFCEEAMATSESALDPARWQGRHAEEVVAAVIHYLVAIYRTRRGMFRAFMMVGRSDIQFQERDRRLGQHFLSRLTALLMDRRDEISHPDPPMAIAFGMELVTATLRDRFVLGLVPAESPRPSNSSLEGELARVYGGYLGLRTAERAELPLTATAGGARS